MSDFDRIRAMAQDDGAEIHICRGPEKGCLGKDGNCPDCYRVSADDPRSAEQILRDMNRGDA